MTTPGGTGIPFLDELIAKAAVLGVDISAQVTKAMDIMAPDTDAMAVGIERLAAITGGLDATRQGLQRDATDAADGWTGQARDAFGPHSAELDNGLTNSGAGITQVNEMLGTARTAIGGGQESVVKISLATLGALRVMGM